MLLALAALVGSPAAAQVRIKDIADIEGVRINQLVGYGLVVGLNGTGDKLDSAVFTRETLVAMLERLGVNTRDQIAELQTKNVAAVMVTAELPAFARLGSRIDISLSALGDATNLTGGTLLVTPLLAADGQVYGVAQGALATGAIAAKGNAGSVTRGVPTAGRIANGATVEREVPYALGSKPNLHLALRNPDLTTAQRIADGINQSLGAPAAHALDPGTVQLDLTGRDVVASLTRIGELRVEPDSAAVVIVEEASGTVVMGANVRVSTVAIAQGQPDHPRYRNAGGEPARRALRRQHRRGGPHQAANRRRPRQETRHRARQRHAARLGGQPECARRRAARSDQHPAIDQGSGCAASRFAGALRGRTA